MSSLINKAVHSLRSNLTVSKFDGDITKSDVIDSVALFLSRLELYDDARAGQSLNSLIRIDEVLAHVIGTFKTDRIDAMYKPLEITGNPEHISAMLGEVIQNALNYSEDSVQVSMHKASGSAVIRVEDFGKGLSTRVQKNIAEPFAASGDSSSVGLGLAIAWEVVQEHSGAMTIISDTGEGTTIIITLNLV